MMKNRPSEIEIYRAARDLGVTEDTIKKRVRKQGMTWREAMTTPKGKGGRKSCVPSLAEIQKASQRLGISVSAIKSRVYTDGMSWDEAMTTPRRNTSPCGRHIDIDIRCATDQDYTRWRNTLGAKREQFCRDCTPVYQRTQIERGKCNNPDIMFFFRPLHNQRRIYELVGVLPHQAHNDWIHAGQDVDGYPLYYEFGARSD